MPLLDAFLCDTSAFDFISLVLFFYRRQIEKPAPTSQKFHVSGSNSIRLCELLITRYFAGCISVSKIPDNSDSQYVSDRKPDAVVEAI
jgi:hypothetical protein